MAVTLLEGARLRATPADAWSTRSLDVARGAAIAVAVSAPISTAFASLASALFVGALLASGRVHHVAVDAWHTPGGKAILAFLAWLLLGVAYSEVAWQPALADMWAWRKLAFLYLALPLFGESRWKNRVIAWLFWVSAVAVALSYLSLALGTPLRGGTANVVGVILVNHATQGAVFIIAAAFGMWLAMQQRGGMQWAILLIVAALVVNVLFFGIGRTGYLVLVAVALCWAMIRGGWRMAAYTTAGLAVLIAAAYVYSPVFQQRIVQTYAEWQEAEHLDEITAIGIRVVFYRNTLAMVRERPLLGYGSGSFRPLYARYVDARHTGVAATHAGDPHNQYLYVAFEHGLAGLALFLIMIVALFRTFPRDGYGMLAACALAAWCAGSLFTSHFRAFPESHFYAFLIAILGARYATAPDRRAA